MCVDGMQARHKYGYWVPDMTVECFSGWHKSISFGESAHSLLQNPCLAYADHLMLYNLPGSMLTAQGLSVSWHVAVDLLLGSCLCSKHLVCMLSHLYTCM